VRCFECSVYIFVHTIPKTTYRQKKMSRPAPYSSALSKQFDIRLVRSENVGLQLSESLVVQKIDRVSFDEAVLPPFNSLLKLGDELVAINGIEKNLTIRSVQTMIKETKPPIWLRFKAFDDETRSIKTIEEFEFDVIFTDMIEAPGIYFTDDFIVKKSNVRGVEVGDLLVAVNGKAISYRSTVSEVNRIVRGLGKALECQLTYCSIVNSQYGIRYTLRSLRFRPPFLEYRPSVHIYRTIEEDDVKSKQRRLYFYTSNDSLATSAPAFSVPFKYAEFGHRVVPCGLYRVVLASFDDDRACGALTIESSRAADGEYMLFAKRGTCRYVDKVRNMQTAGAATAVVVNSYTTIHTMQASEKDEGYDIRIPALMVGLYFRDDAEHSEGELLWSLLSKNSFWVSVC